MKTLSEVKPRELLSNHIHIRLTDSDYNQIKARASLVNLSMSDFMRRAALRRAIPRPLAAFDLKVYQVLCKIDAQLRIAGNNLNQLTKACNSAVALGEPVVVNTGLLESVQQLIRENQNAIKSIVANLAKSTVR
ncbi:MAG: plasmid mobilization relaxosome protein MobC [Oscillatoriales cyanobacterium]|uniref:plasmid mobilization protein n=1 Tax=Microcoleus sp. PH2017_05_CCC_O_A TaxID=2798816 RepID=UPI001D8794B6|nr:plasmid mobilization relaxosome protein MobC [Microcoleus sp. PH2017_05_CCC_O_A]MCC3434384.1 plasmid mobilization relaxosome protein MobC [Microcoleus sp. PH2017_05_CCC_O_A]TAG17438.1 MAG: plasmid mobilization relaxosome protein MobC [Oscillatoriales cyanobacterium]